MNLLVIYRVDPLFSSQCTPASGVIQNIACNIGNALHLACAVMGLYTFQAAVKVQNQPVV